MTTHVPFLPESAPFNDAQRAWLNGFFAGVFSPGQSSGTAMQVSADASPPVVEDDFPWHDSSLVLNDRLKLAEGRPLEHRLMAAMAQLDCGACGYVCQTYSEAIARGEERDFTRCSPGGSDTAKAIKQLVSLQAPAKNGATNGGAAKLNGRSTGTSQYDRNHPYTASLIAVERLTHADSPKDTRHVVIDLADSGLTYEPGDALGICPTNCPELVAAALGALAATGMESVQQATGENTLLREALATNFALNRASDDLFALLEQHAKSASERAELTALRASESDSYRSAADVVEVLQRFPSARPPLDELLATLGKLQPRLYSISSSLQASPRQVHLTVGVVRYEALGRWRNGVASHFLGVRSNAGDPVRVFVQKSKFRLPEDPTTPIIMVGPGTGIAPFRGFLQHREAIGGGGPAWLFFGNQFIDYDFLYRDELNGYLDREVLTKLDLAFLRDTAEKVYVQTRMRQNAAELWLWLDRGAHFYVCGDAKHMAPDVERALLDAISEHGGMSPEAAKRYLADLSKSHRYHKDVY